MCCYILFWLFNLCCFLRLACFLIIQIKKFFQFLCHIKTRTMYLVTKNYLKSLNWLCSFSLNLCDSSSFISGLPFWPPPVNDHIVFVVFFPIRFFIEEIFKNLSSMNSSITIDMHTWSNAYKFALSNLSIVLLITSKFVESSL